MLDIKNRNGLEELDPMYLHLLKMTCNIMLTLGSVVGYG